MKKINLQLGLLCICLVIPFFGYSQTSEEPYYNWFDSLVSIQNAGLYSGVEYIDTDRATAEAHKFFQTPKFVKGDVVFQNQTYYNVSLKYNVFDDRLIVKLSNQSSETALAPIKAFTSGFHLGFHQFVLVNDAQAVASGNTGYYELLQENNHFRLLKKYNKSRITKFDTGRSFFEFKDARADYLLHYKGGYYSVNSKRELTKLFPQFKKEINAVRENKNKTDEAAQNSYIKNVMQRIQGLMSNANNAN